MSGQIANANMPVMQVSGLYVHRQLASSGWGFHPVVTDTVRLDVDGTFPLKRASGFYYPYGLHSAVSAVHWISEELNELPGGGWEALIRRRFPEPAFPSESSLPHDKVRIQVWGGGYLGYLPPARKMTLTFTGSAPDVNKTLEFESPYFRTAEFEFDAVETAPRVTTIDTWAHPEHADVRPRVQSIADVYGYAGIELQESPNTSVLGLEAGGTRAEIWDDQQLHDAMRMFWSRYQPRAQWAGWVLFAHRHVDPNLNGIMFDYGKTQPNDGIHRQGAAIFGDTLADHVPAGEKHPPALWLPRRRFFTAIHEIGHCFHLSHSFEKTDAHPWIDQLRHDPESQALSIMNYPEKVLNFWQNFQYRFDDQELYFLRHAPEEFVEMGNAAAGENHGDRVPLQRGRFLSKPQLSLEIGVSRPRGVFEFLEPINLELKLTNKGDQPHFVDPAILNENQALTLVIVPSGGLPQKWRPYATRRCFFPGLRLLAPEESIQVSIFASAGANGWYLTEPGAYKIHARLDTPGGDILAEPLTVRVASSRTWDEEHLAQDFFTDEVGRALAFGGTQVMTSAIKALNEAADRLKDKAVARHATLALALPLMRNTRVLRLPEGRAPMSSAAADGGKFEVIEARPDEARGLLHKALLSGRVKAVETFGHLTYQRYVEMYASWLHQNGEIAAAVEARAATPDTVKQIKR